jgi:N-acylneuraminate cytidylyltransferase
MKLVTVIPARGGSKSIPLKNIQPLKEIPLIAYSINYSKSCPLISKTIVSTDSNEIAKIAKKYGAEIPFMRPNNISGDEIEDFPVIDHALKFLEKEYGEIIDAVVWLRPTSPLRPAMLIEKAVKLLEKFPECTSIRSVVPSSEHPYRQWKLVNNYIDSAVSGVKTSEPYNLPRQKLPKMYFQSGDIELVRRSTILKGSITGNKVLPLVISKNEMLDIDNFSDLHGAEVKLKDEI